MPSLFSLLYYRDCMRKIYRWLPFTDLFGTTVGISRLFLIDFYILWPAQKPAEVENGPEFDIVDG